MGRLRKFKVGDTVRVIGRKKYCHNFEIGEVCKVFDVMNAKRYCLKSIKSGTKQTLHPVDFKLVVDSTYKKAGILIDEDGIERNVIGVLIEL